MTKYYKYRSLDKLRRFVDIILYKRLWSSTFKELNDPMEGVFAYDSSLSSRYIHTLKDQKYRTYICSLSKTYHNGLMWSFYANEHKGCCLELEVNTKLKDWHKLEVQYVSNVATIEEDNMTVDDILSKKSSQWAYEQEVRYVRTVSELKDNRRKLSVNISRIFLGIKMSDKDRRFYHKLISTIDPSIEVVDITKREIDFGYQDYFDI